MKTKDAVLAILKRQGDFVSGEKISDMLHVSRMAISTAVKALRADGYEIDAATNKGYALKNAPDILSPGELLCFLPPERVRDVLCLDCVDSTNNRLRELAHGGSPAGQIVIAESQTAGRGRYGRSFVSPKSKGIYMSALFRPESVPPACASSLTGWVAVAICNAVEKTCGVRPQIKWVNDLLLGSRKICGILTEMTVESENGHIQYVIVGAGLNVNETADDFPAELKDVATSLSIETGGAFNRARIAAQMIAELDTLRQDWPHNKAPYLDAYRKDCVTVGKTVRVTGSCEGVGVAQSIDDDFGLVVRFDDGAEKTVSSGEVSVHGLYGYV